MPIAYLIYNPNAGNLRIEFLIDRAARELTQAGWELEIKQTKSGDHITQLAQQAVQTGCDALLVAGGDGSLEHAIAGLIDSQTALGVLPTGTANVWAQELGLPSLGPLNLTALETSARDLAAGTIRAVDVGLYNQVPFLLWAGVGLDAYLVHNIEPRRRWQKHLGIPFYITSAIARATTWQGVYLTIEAAGQKVEGEFLLAILSNIRLYAGGLATLSPAACLDDGLMDLWLFQGRSFQDVLKRGIDLWSGNHLNSEEVIHLVVDEMSLSARENLYIQVDGEPVEAGKSATIRVKRRALRILAPPQANPGLFSDLD
jgi:YegS/Rv2252/BmrU family lipid kinase